MKLHEAIGAGLAHLAENRLRSGLSILGIFIGIASVLGMISIGEGAKQIITADLETLGGANQVHFWTRTSVLKNRRRVRRTTERYTLEDAAAIEAESPHVLYVLPKHEAYDTFVSSRDGKQARPHLEGVTADYARGMHWEVEAGRFLSQGDIENAKQVCVLGADTAIELFGKASPLHKEVKLRHHWQHPVRLRVVGVMKTKGRSLSFGYSLDDIICVPLTTYQQRITGIRYIEDLVVFFQKGKAIENIVDSVRHILRKRHRGKDDFIGVWIAKKPLLNLNTLKR